MDRVGLVFLLSTLAVILNVTVATINIGVNYGLLGDNLPHPSDVINLYKTYNIKKLRLFDPNPEVLNALRNSGIEVILGMKNQDLAALAASQDAVNAWFAANVQPYLNNVDIKVITVGNEVIPGDLGPHVLPVMQFLHNLVQRAFTSQSREQLVPVLRQLSQMGSPLYINIYPYYGYASDPVNVRLDYAVFNATETVLKDGSLSYWNMFDAMYDAFVWAMEREGVTDVSLGVSESGWPSGGNGKLTTPEIARKYNRNFVRHIWRGLGTPKRPNAKFDGIVFAMFNENQKPQGIEQNFGLFYPDMKPVYELF